MNLPIGQRIKRYRTEKGFTQQKLEFEIGAAQGSMSRIESGETNPSKETLHKIATSLHLSSFQTLLLYDENISGISDIMNSLRFLYSNPQKKSMMERSLRILAKEINLLGCALFLVEDDYLYEFAFTHGWYSHFMISILRIPEDSMSVTLEAEKNLIAKSVREKETKYTTSLHDIITPGLPPHIVARLQNMSAIKSMQIVPVLCEQKCFGAMVYGKRYREKFSLESPILHSFTKNIAVAIYNSKIIRSH